MPFSPSLPPRGQPVTTPSSYRSLLAIAEFRGLYVSFTFTVAASTLSGFALGTLVQQQTHSPFLTALSMYGATFATVVGALTLMSVADSRRPRRILVRLQALTLLTVAAQTVPELPLLARFALLVVIGFFQSLSTGARMGLLSEVVPASAYALARSLMNITSGGMSILGFTLAALLLQRTSTTVVFTLSAILVGIALLAVATTVREHSVRLSRRPGLRQTWTTNAALLRRPALRVLLVNLWVPNGLIVGCEALLLSYNPRHEGLLLAAGSAGMLLGDLAVGRLLDSAQRARWAFGLRVLLAAPFLLFALHAPLPVLLLAVFASSAGFTASLPLQELLLALTPEETRGQVQGVESAGRMTWQGLGAALAGGVAQCAGVATAIAAMAVTSLLITVATGPSIRRMQQGEGR